MTTHLRPHAAAPRRVGPRAWSPGGLLLAALVQAGCGPGVEGAATLDAAADTAGLDLGATADAGSDRGLPRADADHRPELGPLDADPPHDAAIPDATRADADLNDAGPPDAQAPDARAPDADLPDADAPDTRPPPVEICDNGLDDDASGLADCDDPACAAHPECVLAAPEADCTDGADDDADGLADCDDPGCAREPVCAPPPAFTEDDLRNRFVADCNQCHPFLIDEFLGLTANRSTAGLRMVEPGSHRDSYLWHKLNGSHLTIGGRGDPMPIGRPRWSPADVARFGAWINGRPPRP